MVEVPVVLVDRLVMVVEPYLLVLVAQVALVDRLVMVVEEEH
jgi:hypothetical protein